jgi:hypothetical protein
MSLGTEEVFPGECDSSNSVSKAAVDNLRTVGIATIGPSGNEESTTGIGSPACISSVVSVGSTDDGSSDRDGSETTRAGVSDFSNTSPELDLLAPGRWITSSYPENYFATTFGTSLSVPHVSGAWAVLKSKVPNASVDQVLSALQSTGVSVTDSRNNITRSRIQVDAALNDLESQPRFFYTSGTSLTLTASPNPGFRFRNWRGCDSVAGNRCTVRISSARNVTALFESISGEGLTPLNSNRWIIPTTANVPGRFGGIFKTNLTLANLNEEAIEVTARLYGTQGLVKEATISLEAVTYHTWNDFLDSLFGYRGAGAVEFAAEKPFQVASVEVYIDSSSGRNTTVVVNQPTPPLLYRGSATSFGVSVNDDKRTNIGVFNSSGRSQTVTARVHSAERGADPVQIITFNLPAKGYSQKSVSARVENGFIRWQIPEEAYLYVVSVDNSSNDGTLTFPIPLE